MRKKGILFDFDGVTVKSMEQHFKAWQEAFAEKGVEISRDDFFILEGMGIKKVAHILGEHHGLDKEAIMEVMDRKVNYYNQFMTIEFYEYFKEMLKSFKEKELPMGVVTGGSRSRVQKIIEEYFNNDFNCLVTVDDVKRGKPFPDPFLKGAEMLGIPAQDCIVVENAPKGIEGAVKAGMTVIGITTTLTAKDLHQANYIAADFKEVERIVFSLIKV